MTSETANAWLLTASLGLAVCIGFSITAASARTVWLTRTTLWATVIFGGLGAALLLSPKWTSLIVNYGDLKIVIAGLQDELDKQHSQLASYESKIAKLELNNKLFSQTITAAMPILHDMTSGTTIQKTSGNDSESRDQQVKHLLETLQAWSQANGGLIIEPPSRSSPAADEWNRELIK